MTVNGIQITQATIEATREWFAQNARDCVEGATTGKYHVNDLRKYIEWQNRREREALNGHYDHSLTFIQRALYIQTGECPALLS